MSSKNGFTFIELVIVIVVVCILTAIFSPRLLHLIDSHRADAAAEQIASHLRLAQEYTISQHITHGVWFGTSEEHYCVYSKWDSSKDPIKNPLRPGQDLVEDFTDEKSKLYGVTIESANFGPNSDKYSVEFNSLGAPNYSGYVNIAKGGETRNIGVERETGTVSIW
jgi:prepilin-type N-terminal cleavage/methylation domain-containing protein